MYQENFNWLCSDQCCA